MPTYVALYRWTDQGIRTVKDTVARARENMAGFEKAGGKIKALYYTQGRYDLIAISEAPNEETAQAFVLAQGKSGYLRTETMRAFSMEEMESILKKVP